MLGDLQIGKVSHVKALEILLFSFTYERFVACDESNNIISHFVIFNIVAFSFWEEE